MRTLLEVRRSLKTLPDTLTEIYDKIYKHIVNHKGSAPRQALNDFRWMQSSYEPMRTETLLDAITAEIRSSGEFSHEDSMRANDLLRACRNLIILDEGLGFFRFAHLSVDEYLETQLHNIDSHAAITQVCLSLLCTPDSCKCYDWTIKTEEADYTDRHLLLYSATFWPWHISRSGDSASSCPSLTGLWNTFVLGDNHQRWFRYHSTSVTVNENSRGVFWLRSYELRNECHVLHSVAVFGLSRIFAPVFLTRSVPMLHMNRLLLQSCRFGDLGAAQVLLEQGAGLSAAAKYK